MEEKENRELVIEEAVETQEENESVEFQETSTVDVKTEVEAETMGELIEASYNHANNTLKKGERVDWFVLCCGLFAIICLVVSAYNVVRYGFDWLFGLMMLAYVLIAVFCLVQKLQYLTGKLFWKLGFRKKLKAAKADDKLVHFGEEEFTYSCSGKEIKVAYDTMWDTYETENYYVFQVKDRCLVPIARSAVAEAEQEYEGEDLQAYFKALCDKYGRTSEE